MLKAAVLAVGLVAAGAAAAEPTSNRPMADLRNLLVQDCGSCHGLTMRGGLGPPLLPRNLEGRAEDALVEIILDGMPGTPMPPWRPYLRPHEAAWMVEQLKKGLTR